MSTLGELAGAAGGAVTGGLWKVATIVLAVLLLAGGGAGGALWWSAAAARDDALAKLEAERGVSAELRAGVVAQNAAILAQATLAREAEARGLAAQQLAAANGRRFDGALQQLAGARATTCDEAMPAVDQLLKDLK